MRFATSGSRPQGRQHLDGFSFFTPSGLYFLCGTRGLDRLKLKSRPRYFPSPRPNSGLILEHKTGQEQFGPFRSADPSGNLRDVMSSIVLEAF